MREPSAAPAHTPEPRQQCGVCGSFLNDDAAPGKHECPKCGTVYEVPAAPLAPQEIADMRALYGPIEVPPCRICGGPMTIGSVGGGPTVWRCNVLNVSREQGRRPTEAEWAHYGDSEWRDHRCGGDSRVIRALNALAGASDPAAVRALVEACRKLVTHSNRWLTVAVQEGQADDEDDDVLAHAIRALAAFPDGAK